MASASREESETLLLEAAADDRQRRGRLYDELQGDTCPDCRPARPSVTPVAKRSGQ